jgi:hypothetical protein
MADEDRPYTPKQERQLMTELWDPQLADDPLAFVMFAFPWGKENTPLHNKEGPRDWQREELARITEHLKNQRERAEIGLPYEMYQSATASGRGVGKSALTAWINWWFLSTRLGGTSITTANTEDQLKHKTWAELGKWKTLAINSHWFDKQVLSLKPMPWFADSLKKGLKIDSTYYYANATLWSEEKSDAFAGAHNEYGELVIFDEASGIPKVIWTVTEGFFTEPIINRFWFCFSNPRRNTGEFYECFNKNRKYWFRRNLDSRDVEGTDTAKLQQIVDRHGDDSDEARMEVKGQFPRQGDQQFISRQLIEDAQLREMSDPDPYAGLVMGVDLARFGDDESVIMFRQGRNARTLPHMSFKHKDTMQMASIIADWINKMDPDAICIDTGGVGGGVYDRLREMGYRNGVHSIEFGKKAEDPDSSFGNIRTEIWDRMRSWLSQGCISTDANLDDELAGPRYEYMGRSDKQILEPKEKMKKRGLKSPDNADALALTFAVTVPHRDLKSYKRKKKQVAKGVDYRIFKR